MRRTYGYCLICIFCLLCGCKKFGAESLPDNDPASYSEGDAYTDAYGNKGIIAFARDLNDGRVVFAISADETTAAWGPVGEAAFQLKEWWFTENVVEDYVTGYFFGLNMSQRVEQLGMERFPAFAWCNAKNKDGKPVHSSSWMLPTKAELTWVFGLVGVEALNQYMETIGGTPFPTDGTEHYWTATEDFDQYIKFADEEVQAATDYDQASRAVCMNVNRLLYVDKSRWTKDHSYRVRAIKYVYMDCPAE